MNCPYCKGETTKGDIFCSHCDSRLYTPRDFLNMKEFSPLDSILKWIDFYRSGKYTLGQFQTRVGWLIEAVKLQKEQYESIKLPPSIPQSARQIQESFLQILGLMLDALENTDQHLREGQDELLKKSLVTIHEVHNKLHDLKDTMIESFPKEELLNGGIDVKSTGLQ